MVGKLWQYLNRRDASLVAFRYKRERCLSRWREKSAVADKNREKVAGARNRNSKDTLLCRNKDKKKEGEEKEIKDEEKLILP